MAACSNYALRVPSSLMEDLRVASVRDGVSMNGFIVQAVAEKVAALRARGLLGDLDAESQSDYLEERAGRAKPGQFRQLLARSGKDAKLLGDEVPEGWLEVAPDLTDATRP